MNALKRRIRSLLVAPGAPRSLSRRFRTISAEQTGSIEESLRRNYFSTRPEGFLETAEGRKALEDQLRARIRQDREWFVPWVSSVRSLDGLRVLEIGCGTGSSTVALAEQGALVTALDVDEGSLEVARERVQAYDLPVKIVHGNVADFGTLFPGERFDLIVFYASIEHMTHEERITSMKATWDALEPGALWCISETPNRLWWLDTHTSRLPFFQWLPDDLALKYTPFSPRPMIRDLIRDGGADPVLGFLRKGRGVSYHEFELAMKPLAGLKIASCLRLHYRQRRPLRWVRRRGTIAGRYERFLAEAAPQVPRAFLLPSLDLILEKD